MENKKVEGFLRSLGMFAAKAVIVVLLLQFLLPDFSEIRADLAQQKTALKAQLVKTFGNERSRLYALSFVQNPAVLYKTSEIAERDANLDSAIRDMEIAIGLLEMHNTDKQVLKRYGDRLDKLKAAAKEKK